MIAYHRSIILAVLGGAATLGLSGCDRPSRSELMGNDGTRDKSGAVYSGSGKAITEDVIVVANQVIDTRREILEELKAQRAEIKELKTAVERLAAQNQKAGQESSRAR